MRRSSRHFGAIFNREKVCPVPLLVFALGKIFNCLSRKSTPKYNPASFENSGLTFSDPPEEGLLKPAKKCLEERLPLGVN